MIWNRNHSAVVLDVGGVLLRSPSLQALPLSPRLILNALDSPTWHELERDKISEDDCNREIATTFKCDLSTWQKCLSVMRASLVSNSELIFGIKKLKKLIPTLQVFGLFNMPSWDYEQLKSTLDEWDIFDNILISANLQQRKPDDAAYKAFLDTCGIDAGSCIFVDDRLENVVAAQSLGYEGILFETTESTIRQLYQRLVDPANRGRMYLRANAKSLFCELSTGGVQPDNYSQLLILEHTGERDLVTIEKKGPTMNYFIGTPVFANTTYPNDSDTTSLAMVVLKDVTQAEKEDASRAILDHLNPDGLPYCWLDKERPRFCHCICANVFRFFYLNGQAEKLPGVYEYLCRLLRTGAFRFGTRYYTTPDWIFYYLSDVCSKCPFDPALDELRHLLAWRIKERMGTNTNDVLACVLRLLASQALGLHNPGDLQAVIDAQLEDGGWPAVWLWQYGKEKVKLSSRGVVTAMAVRALENAS